MTMTPGYKALLAQVSGDTDPRHVEALLQGIDGRNSLDNLTQEQAAFCIAMARACVKAFGADLVERIARERGI